MKTNPFTTSFGKEPQSFISRYEEENTIISSFSSKIPSQQVFMITGVRGSGKTALLTRVKKKLLENNEWIIVELSSEGDLLNDLIAKLCDKTILRSQFVKAKINLSLLGVDLKLEGVPPVNSVYTALEKMLKVIKQLNKRLLITIDEVTNNKNMRSFSSEFQILMREDYPVFLIMTGLYKNLYDLQNEQTLTFLYRAPKITLGSLNNIAVVNSYKDIFNITTEEAMEMSKNVRGYAFAYQLYGSLCFELSNDNEKSKILKKYREILGELVYEKLWSELSIKDKEIMTVIASLGNLPIKIGNVIGEYNKKYPQNATMTDKLMSVYKERLKREGLIESPRYGYIQIALPTFADYVNEYGAII